MKTNVIYWTPWAPNKTEDIAALVLFAEPIPVLKDLSLTHKGASFLRCPAFIDYCKNTYVIKAQIDMTFSFDAEKNWMSASIESQAYYDAFVRFDSANLETNNGSRRITIPARYVFYSKDEMMVELVPPFLQGHTTPNNFNIVPGIFDISKWIRPVECSGLMIDLSTPIKVKQGDALMYLKFIPKDKGKVTMQRELITEDLINVAGSCTAVKTVVRNTPLDTLYKLAASTIAVFKKSKSSKCPFSRLWK